MELSSGSKHEVCQSRFKSYLFQPYSWSLWWFPPFKLNKPLRNIGVTGDEMILRTETMLRLRGFPQLKMETIHFSPILKCSSEPPTKRFGLHLVGFFLKIIQKKLGYFKYLLYISTVIMSDMKETLREISREELETILLDGKFINVGLEAINPKVFYTILGRIQKINKIKL